MRYFRVRAAHDVGHYLVRSSLKFVLDQISEQGIILCLVIPDFLCLQCIFISKILAVSSNMINNYIKEALPGQLVVLVPYFLKVMRWTQKEDETLLHFEDDLGCIFEFAEIINQSVLRQIHQNEWKHWHQVRVKVSLV